MARATPPMLLAAYRCDEETQATLDKVLPNITDEMQPLVREALLELGRRCHAQIEHLFINEVLDRCQRAKQRAKESEAELNKERQERLLHLQTRVRHGRTNTPQKSSPIEKHEKQRIGGLTDG